MKESIQNIVSIYDQNLDAINIIDITNSNDRKNTSINEIDINKNVRILINMNLENINVEFSTYENNIKQTINNNNNKTIQLYNLKQYDTEDINNKVSLG